MIALLLPALTRARRQAQQIKCLSNVRQIALGEIQYAQDNDLRLPLLSETAVDQWEHQYGQLIKLQRYVTNFDVFHCPSVDGPEDAQSGANPGYIGPVSGIPIFVTSIDGIQRYTDYKINDSWDVVGKPTPPVVPGRKITWFNAEWLVVTLDIDFNFRPRHGEGENLAFLDGHGEWRHRNAYRAILPGAADPYGNLPWYNWGRRFKQP